MNNAKYQEFEVTARYVTIQGIKTECIWKIIPVRYYQRDAQVRLSSHSMFNNNFQDKKNHEARGKKEKMEENRTKEWTDRDGLPGERENSFSFYSVRTVVLGAVGNAFLQ